MKQSRSHDIIKRRIIPGIFAALIIISYCMIQPVLGNKYPKNNDSYTLQDETFKRPYISWDENDDYYACAWATYEPDPDPSNDFGITFALALKSGFEKGSKISWQVKKNLEYVGNATLNRSIRDNYDLVSEPSIIITPGGVLVMLLRMVKKGEIHQDFYIIRSEDLGNTWTLPFLLTNYDLRKLKVNTLRLVEVEDKLVALWLESNTPSDYNYSLVYRVSSDYGLNWDNKSYLIRNISVSSAYCMKSTGRLAIGFSVNLPGNYSFATYHLYILELTGDISSWNVSNAFSLSPNASVGTAKFNLLNFNGELNDYMYDTGTRIFYSDTEEGSLEYTLENFQDPENPRSVVSIANYFKLDEDDFIFFFTIEGVCYYSYLSQIDWRADLESNDLMVIFVVIIVCIIAGQIILYYGKKYQKKKKSKKQQTDARDTESLDERDDDLYEDGLDEEDDFYEDDELDEDLIQEKEPLDMEKGENNENSRDEDNILDEEHNKGKLDTENVQGKEQVDLQEDNQQKKLSRKKHGKGN